MDSKVTETFIRTYDALPHDFCNRVVDLFEANIASAEPGKTLAGHSDHKISLDIHITHNDPIWVDVNKVLYESAGELINKYMQEFIDCFNATTPQLGDAGYAIRRYEKGTGFFGLHSDVNGLKSSHRMLAVIWYFNTVDEGGETKFPMQGVSVKPEIGKALIFPTNWTHLHSGEKAVSHHKYIARTFITYQGL